MVNCNARYPDWQWKGKDCHRNQISRRFASNRLATDNGNVGDEEYDIWDNVDDVSIVTSTNTMSNSIFVIMCPIAIEVTDSGDEDKYSNESNRDHELAQKCRIHFPDELRPDLLRRKWRSESIGQNDIHRSIFSIIVLPHCDFESRSFPLPN